MKKKILTIIATLIFCGYSKAQILFSNSLGNLVLSSYTSGNIVTQYTTVPSVFSVINDNYANNVGSISNPNAPFHIPSMKYAGWSVVYNSNVNDTFLVSTSWLDNTSQSSDKWVITPTVNVSANTVLTWLAMSPDPNHPDGYEVYGTNKTGNLIPSDFTIGDRLFLMPDAQTPGGGEHSTWTRRSVAVGLFAGQTLRFAFRNNSKDMYQLWIDDIEVKNTSFSSDAAAVSAETKKYIFINTADSVHFNISNLGATDIKTVTVSYKYGNSSVESQAFAPNLSYGQTARLNFSLPFSLSSPGNYELKCWINSVNGTPDQNLANDTARVNVTVQSSSPAKTLLMEQFVSAFDKETVDAQEKALALQGASVVQVNIHTGDSLKDLSSSALKTDYFRKNSTAMIDRSYFRDLSSNTIPKTIYQSKIAEKLADVTPVAVSVINKSYNISTRELVFTVRADFTGDVKGDYRINACLTENQVTGNLTDTTVNGYNQLNGYYNVPWSPYYQKGYFSPAYNSYVLDGVKYKHQNLLLHSFDGAYGNPGVIPQTGGTAGQSYTQTYSITLPSFTTGVHEYNPDNIYIVAYVAEYSSDLYQRNVLNAVKEKLNTNAEVVGIRELAFSSDLRVFPNPSAGKVYLSSGSTGPCELRVVNTQGMEVLRSYLHESSGMSEVNLSALPEGIYIISVKTGSGTYHQKILIGKD